MALVRSLGSSFSPFDACWVDLLPDQAHLEASQGKVWMIRAVLVPVALGNAWYPLRDLLLSQASLEGLESIETLATAAIMCSGWAVSGVFLEFYVRTTDLVSARRMVYCLHLCLGIFPIMTAVVDPVGVT